MVRPTRAICRLGASIDIKDAAWSLKNQSVTIASSTNMTLSDFFRSPGVDVVDGCGKCGFSCCLRCVSHPKLFLLGPMRLFLCFAAFDSLHVCPPYRYPDTKVSSTTRRRIDALFTQALLTLVPALHGFPALTR
jgi:hypothetical protein